LSLHAKRMTTGNPAGVTEYALCGRAVAQASKPQRANLPEGGFGTRLNAMHKWHDVRGIPAVKARAGARTAATSFDGVFLLILSQPKDLPKLSTARLPFAEKINKLSIARKGLSGNAPPQIL